VNGDIVKGAIRRRWDKGQQVAEKAEAWMKGCVIRKVEARTRPCKIKGGGIDGGEISLHWPVFSIGCRGERCDSD
jgi:hypothetical protein